MWDKDGRFDICIPKQGVVNKEANLTFAHIYSSALPQFCDIFAENKICADPFFRPVKATAYATGICSKRLQNPCHALTKTISIESCTLDAFNTDC